MILYVLVGLAVVIGVIAMIATTKPNDWTQRRETTIPALPAEVFACVNDLHKFNEWSPWAKLDPNMKLTYSGPESGPGASFSWEGNSQIGIGKMTVTESSPNDFVHARLDFLKPLKCTNTQEFLFKSEAANTVVSWRISGTSPFIFKLMLVFTTADKMMGKNLEDGLATLKSLVTGASKVLK